MYRVLVNNAEVNILKASIKGVVQCNSDENTKRCTDTLDRFNITHTLDGMKVLIDTFINVTAWFDRDGFEHMLNRKLSHCGKCNIGVSGMTIN